MLNLGILVSGRGSNMQAIHRAIQGGSLDASIALVVASKPGALALDYCREQGIATLVLPKQSESERPVGDILLEALQQHGADFLVLAGYLKLVPPEVIAAYPNRIVNVHPALLPAFGGPGMYGHYVHEAVLASGARVSGATVHIVDEEYDKGLIVMQETVPVLDDDTPETLAARVLSVEHRILPEALRAFAEDRVTINNRSTVIINPLPHESH